jgi:hypothetical protein
MGELEPKCIRYATAHPSLLADVGRIKSLVWQAHQIKPCRYTLLPSKYIFVDVYYMSIEGEEGENAFRAAKDRHMGESEIIASVPTT